MVDIFLSFLIGGVVGGASVYWFLREPKRGTTEDLEMRIVALEETMAYTLGRFEEVAVTGQQKAPRPRSKKQPVESDEDWQRVLSLAAEGLDTQTIARRVGKPQGQVELITKLYPKG